VTLSIFMEGTANPIDRITTQISLFSKICAAAPLSSDKVILPPHIPAECREYKLGFPGCGVSHGLRGTLFAHGLRDQVAIVRGYMDAFVSAGHSVVVNFVGLSRGGIGGLYLAQELASFSVEQVLVNLLLFDPVPGNLIWMSRYVDWAGIMNANLAMDVSQVQNLGSVVVLYPYEPLPDIAFHAPLLPQFPAQCRPHLDVILGCHQGALWLRPKADTCLAFAYIRDFLRECGSSIDTQKNLARDLDMPDVRLEQMLSEELMRDMPITRSVHAAVRGSLVVRHSRAQFLNRYHEALLARLQRGAHAQSISDPKYMLDLVIPSAA